MLTQKNPHLNSKEDFWYHLGFGPTEEVKRIFKDVKFVCMGGKNRRMKYFAEYLYESLGKPSNSALEEETNVLKDLAVNGGRYCLYKVGNCISASHGMGMDSFSILLHEMLKLLTFCGCKDPAFIRLGTSGGIGVEPGTTIITDRAYNGLLQPFFNQNVCGKVVKYESRCDKSLSELLLLSGNKLKIKIQIANTMSCEGFYEEQGRLDGALCSYTSAEKMNFLKKAHDECGIRNIEMEVNMMSSLCRRYGVRCATICVTILDRLEGDTVTTNRCHEFESNPLAVVAELIKCSL